MILLTWVTETCLTWQASSSAHKYCSVSQTEGTENIWFLIWWSEEPGVCQKVKDKECGWVPQRHQNAESQEVDQFMSLSYPWWPRDCKGLGCWGLSRCAVTMQPQVALGDGSSAGVALQCSALALQEVTEHCKTADSLSPWCRQIHTNLILRKWSNTANSSALSSYNLLVHLSNNCLLSLDGETIAVSARGLNQGHLAPDGCVFPGDS